MRVLVVEDDAELGNQLQKGLREQGFQVDRYDDAVQHYLVALRSDPANTNWLVGTIMTLGTPQDVTLQELRIETFFPADPESERTIRAMGKRG
jgi:DNA-binding response OmpR family regulator